MKKEGLIELKKCKGYQALLQAVEKDIADDPKRYKICRKIKLDNRKSFALCRKIKSARF